MVSAPAKPPRTPTAQPDYASQCASLEAAWKAEARRALTHTGHNPGLIAATRQFREACPEEERAARDAWQHELLAQGPAGFTRVRTEGAFGDWLEPFDEQGCRGDDASRDRCAEAMIARAVAERRLAQAEVDACWAAVQATPPRATDPRKAEIQRQREASAAKPSNRRVIGAWALWRGERGCQIQHKVSASFSDRSHIPTSARNRPTTPGDRDCGLNVVDPPRCDLAAALVKPGYERWESRTYEECARKDPQARVDGGYCTRKTIERALAEKQISLQAHAQCQHAALAGGPAVNTCLEAHAIRDRVSTSRIVRRQAPARSPAVDTRGYKKPALINAIAHADWATAPVAEPDYGITLFARFNDACPNLGYDELLPRLAQREMQAGQSALGRVFSGQGSAQDMTRILMDGYKTLGGLENCERLPAYSSQREQCERDRETRRDTPASPDGEHDARRWLGQHACTSPATRRFGERLVEWLFLDDAARGSMNWAANHPRRKELTGVFENCRAQAGDHVADAWCGCYVREFSKIQQDDSRFRNATVLAATRESAFVGHNAWFNQFSGASCDALAERIDGWRLGQSARPRVTACLVGERPAPERLAPGVRACRYRTAWGEIEFHDTTCRDRLYAHQWGSETVACEGGEK